MYVHYPEVPVAVIPSAAVCIRMQKDYKRTLKVLQFMSKFDGLWKHALKVSGVFRQLKEGEVEVYTSLKITIRCNTQSIYIVKPRDLGNYKMVLVHVKTRLNTASR